jgi:hypothetical protein
VTKTKRKTKPVPLNKMTRKQLLSELRTIKSRGRKIAEAVHRTHIGAIDQLATELRNARNERDDFRQSLNGALEEIAALKGKLAVQALI